MQRNLRQYSLYVLTVTPTTTPVILYKITNLLSSSNEAIQLMAQLRRRLVHSHHVTAVGRAVVTRASEGA